jgi:hypothetical protein
MESKQVGKIFGPKVQSVIEGWKKLHKRFDKILLKYQER